MLNSVCKNACTNDMTGKYPKDEEKMNMQKHLRKRTMTVLFGVIITVLFIAGYGLHIYAQAAVTGTVTASTLFIRTGPSTNYDKLQVNGKIAYLSRGDKVAISYESNGWYYVTASFEGKKVTGFVSADYISVTDPVPTAAPSNTPKPTSTPKPTQAPVPTPTQGADNQLVTTGFPRAGTVTASRLNVRRGAGTGHEAIAVIVRTAKVTVLAVEKNTAGEYWYQISFSQDGVTRTGYVMSTYIAVDAPVATKAPTSPSPTSAPKPSKTPTPTPTPVVSVAGERVTREEIDDDNAVYYYTGIVTAHRLNLREGASTSTEALAVIDQNTQVMIVNETVSGTSIWYRVAVKQDGKILYGYMLSKYVKLLFEEPVSAQIIWERVKLRNRASFTGAYVKTDSGEIISLNIGETIRLISETTIDGVKWLEAAVERGGRFYTGFVPEEMVLFTEETSLGPSPIPSPIPTPTPTVPPVWPTQGPAATITPRPTPTPRPTTTPRPTPAPTSGALPTPQVYDGASGYPVNRAGTLTGYGTTSKEMLLVAYEILEYPFTLVNDANGNPIILEGREQLYLYDQYIAPSSMDIYWHVGFLHNGKMYYGYIPWEHITEGMAGDTNQGNQGITGNDADFEYLMELQGFPESYKPYLRELHEKHPAWVFEAFHTNLLWDTVIEEEGIAGRNLIPNSKGIAWKSLETGAYDWATDKFILYDGSTWVTASKAAIAYYMDPRNFLNETNVFMFEVLRYAPSYQNEMGVESVLANTPFYYSSYNYTDEFGIPQTYTYAQTFIAAAEYSGVSPYHLAARVKQEVVTSSTTVSNSVTGTVSGLEGLYNFYNIGAYHSTVAGGAIANALKYAKNGASNNDEQNDAALIPWRNPYNAIVGGAYILGSTYINRGQDTIYLQKFNVTENSTYYHQYMANVEAPMAESKKTASAYTNVSSLPIVFSVPVYLDMPQQNAPMPGEEYNPNNWLKELHIYDIDGNELLVTPTFQPKVDQLYYLVADSDDMLLQVEAEPVSKKATVLGTGFIGLEYGSNTITIMVIAENGDVREYTIIVAKEE